MTKQGFSTIIAIMMTAFLIILSAGLLNLYLLENKTSHFLSNGTAAYAAAEGSLEYGLLKIANHQSGFQDAIRTGFASDQDAEAALLQDIGNAKKTRIGYEMETAWKEYSGNIANAAFEVFPLFSDLGSTIQTNAKNPNNNTSNIQKVSAFTLIPQGELVWNIIGNIPNGTTDGISGVTNGANPIDKNTTGFQKLINSNNDLETKNVTVGTFLATHENNYLVIYNSSNVPVQYALKSLDNAFSLPLSKIVSSASVGDSKQNIELRENKSKYFDLLKYSIFNK